MWLLLRRPNTGDGEIESGLLDDKGGAEQNSTGFVEISINLETPDTFFFGTELFNRAWEDGLGKHFCLTIV